MRVRISGLIFTTFILVDFIGTLNSVEILEDNLLKTNPDIVPNKADLPDRELEVVEVSHNKDMEQVWLNRKERKKYIEETKGRESVLHVGNGTNIFITEEDKSKILVLLLETFLFLVLLVSNILALLGVIRKEAYLLVPWLCVYLLGICR